MSNVLIVDDSMFARRRLKSILIQAGYTVVAEASNGMEALSKYKEFKPDIVTMDITMPLKSGLEAVKSIISIDSNAKIIMVTAIDQKTSVFEAIQSGAKHYIIKPFDYKKIITVFDKVLSDNENSVEPISDKKALPHKRSQDFIPLSLETRNNYVIINIQSNLNSINFVELKKAVNLLFNLKPLKLIFNFADIETLEDSVIGKIAELLESIYNIDGKVVFFSKSETLIKLLVNKNINVLISHYTNSLDVSNIEI